MFMPFSENAQLTTPKIATTPKIMMSEKDTKLRISNARKLALSMRGGNLVFSRALVFLRLSTESMFKASVLD